MRKQKFPRPELLLHPNIPKPLHGVNPRNILGQKWWNIVRRRAYLTHNYHCWACGIHKSKAQYHQWLEAHEVYDIDYATGKIEMKDICALCHSCHNYIHDGRMQMLVMSGQFAFEKYIDILNHGEKIISKYLEKVVNNYSGKPWKKPLEASQPFQYVFPEIKVPGSPKPTDKMIAWSDWHLVFNGKKYYSRFRDFDEWQAYYQ